jgi:hypothetical protein
VKVVEYVKSVQNVKIVECECVTWDSDLCLGPQINECAIKETCYVELYPSTA